jgi:hypothetical protein
VLALAAVLAVVLVVVLASGGDDEEEPADTSARTTEPATGEPPPPPPPPEKTVPLQSLREGAAGSALVMGREDATVVELRPRGLGAGTHQVWLYDSVASAQPLRRFEGSPEAVRVRLGPDAGRYTFLDVSAEPDDGNPNHSGASVLRIPLGNLLESG